MKTNNFFLCLTRFPSYDDAEFRVTRVNYWCRRRTGTGETFQRISSKTPVKRLAARVVKNRRYSRAYVYLIHRTYARTLCTAVNTADEETAHCAIEREKKNIRRRRRRRRSVHAPHVNMIYRRQVKTANALVHTHPHKPAVCV